MIGLRRQTNKWACGQVSNSTVICFGESPRSASLIFFICACLERTNKLTHTNDRTRRTFCWSVHISQTFFMSRLYYYYYYYYIHAHYWSEKNNHWLAGWKVYQGRLSTQPFIRPIHWLSSFLFPFRFAVVASSARCSNNLLEEEGGGPNSSPSLSHFFSLLFSNLKTSSLKLAFSFFSCFFFLLSLPCFRHRGILFVWNKVFLSLHGRIFFSTHLP